MNITLFNRRHWIRRFGEQINVSGYLTTPHEDMVVNIHVHPAGNDTLQGLPEGERGIQRLEAHNCDTELFAANQDTGRKGDLLYYHGEWYECVPAVLWDHTVLSHWNYQFTVVPKDVSGSVDYEPPKGEPL